MIVVVCTVSAGFSGVEGLWLSSFLEPVDPVLLQKKNQTARATQEQQQQPRMRNVIRIPAAAATKPSRLIGVL